VPGAIGEVPGIECEHNRFRIVQPEEARDLIRRLDLTRTVVVEGRAQSGFGSNRASDSVRTLGEGPPFGRAQAQFACHPPGVERAAGTVTLASASTTDGGGSDCTAGACSPFDSSNSSVPQEQGAFPVRNAVSFPVTALIIQHPLLHLRPFRSGAPS